MAKILKLNYFRKGRATNSSSTHSVIYKNHNEMFEDLNIFEEDYYDRCCSTIAATREAKIKYVFACIFQNETLAEIMSKKYPEMKQYFHLVKKEENRKYNENDYMPYIGEHMRGDLSPFNDFEITYETLCNIIDNDEIVIVGGSDEQDFFYDTIKGHKKVAPSYFSKKKGTDIIKNGNYYLGYDSYGDKVRLCTTNDNAPIPEFPELIDLLITKKCSHGCPFCYNNSSKKGKDATTDDVCTILRYLKHPTEFSIGGGNIIEHNNLEEIFRTIKRYNRKHIINVTIKVDDINTILNDDKLKKVFHNYVDGIGISVQNNDEHLKLWESFNIEFNDKFVVIHVIPELIGVAKTNEICETAYEIYNLQKSEKILKYPHVLFLGFKKTGRASDMDAIQFTPEDLDTLFDSHCFKSIDTSFAMRYKSWLDGSTYEKSVTFNEGEYSMYIDAVNMKAYRCSYDLSKPYPIGEYNWENNKLYDIFSKIRYDGGFRVYNEKCYKKYYDEE